MNLFKVIRTIFKVLNIISLTLKAILVFSTFITVMLFGMGIEDIVENGYPICWLFVIVIESVLCWGFISEDDINKLSFNKHNTDDILD